MGVLRTERDSLLKAVLFELPPDAVAPGPTDGPEFAGVAIRSLNQSIQAIEHAMDSNKWYYGKNVKDQNYPLKFKTADKTWNAINDRSIHGTWKIYKEAGHIELHLTFENNDTASCDLIAFDPLTFNIERSTRYGMNGFKIYSQPNPISIGGDDVGHQIGDVVDALESLMIGKRWVAGRHAINGTTGYRFYRNHTYAEIPYDDISGQWKLQNNGSSNILTMTNLIEVGNGSFIEQGTTKFEMLEGNNLMAFSAFESSWTERAEWVLT